MFWKYGSRNLGIDIASLMALAFGPIAFWILPRDHSYTQICDK
jgi:hypothetical protein